MGKDVIIIIIIPFLSTYLPIYISTYLPIYLSIYLPTVPYIYVYIQYDTGTPLAHL